MGAMDFWTPRNVNIEGGAHPAKADTTILHGEEEKDTKDKDCDPNALVYQLASRKVKGLLWAMHCLTFLTRSPQISLHGIHSIL